MHALLAWWGFVLGAFAGRVELVAARCSVEMPTRINALGPDEAFARVCGSVRSSEAILGLEAGWRRAARRASQALPESGSGLVWMRSARPWKLALLAE